MSEARTEGSLSSADVRAHNLGLVLTHLDRVGTASRTEIAHATGLARGAITSLVAELADASLVRATASEPAPSGRAGRPRETLELDGTRAAVLGIQFSLDTILVRTVDLAGRTLLSGDHDVRTPHGDPGALADLLAAHASDAIAAARAGGAEVIRLVVVVPAPVLSDSRVIPLAIDFGWADVDLSALLAARLEMPPLGIRVVNDANSAAYAEFDTLRQAHPDLDDIVYLKSDTGIGGGAVVSGTVLTGATGFAFEPGHTVVVPDGIPCSCGKRGCLVTVAGPEAVLRRAGLAGIAEADGVPAALEELVRRRRQGDPDAVAAVAWAAAWIRLTLANSIALFQPRFIVLGGYLADVVDELSALPELVLRFLGEGDHRGRDAVLPASHGRHSGIDGALLLERHELLSSPAPLRP